MANLTSSFSTLSDANAAYNLLASASTSSALNSIGNSFSNTSNIAVLSFSLQSATKIIANLTNGDTTTLYGTNLLGYPQTITRLDYNFSSQNIQLTMLGSVSAANASSDPTGSLNHVVLVDNSLGYPTTYTMNGTFYVDATPDIITDIKIEINGASLLLAGNLTDDSLGNISGNITSALFTSGTYTANLTNLNMAYSTYDAFTNFTDFLASALRGNDIISGTASGEMLLGFAGDDVLNGLGGNDTLDGGDGNDTINGGLGVDTMTGGKGNDIYYVDDVHDLVDEKFQSDIKLVSSNQLGIGGEGFSQSISADGKFITFLSQNSNFVFPDPGISTIRNYLKNIDTGEIFLASSNAAGLIANSSSNATDISDNGRYVVFEADMYTTNLANDTNFARDIYLKDLQTGLTQRESTDVNGSQSNGHSYNPTISGDGRYILFQSDADNLVANDTNQFADLFLKDTQTGSIRRVTTDSAGNQFTFFNNNYLHLSDGALSSNGNFAVFTATLNSIPLHVFIKNIQTGELREVDTTSNGEVPNSPIHNIQNISISADGRFVVFQSDMINLVSNGIVNNRSFVSNIYCKDMQTGEVKLVSTSSSGEVANDSSFAYKNAISSDGRFVVFSSRSTNLSLEAPAGDEKIFVKDMFTGFLKTITTGDNQAVLGSHGSISEDGHYIFFGSGNIYRVTNPLYFEIGLVTGIDTINSSVSYSLPTYVENLTLSGSFSINGTGNQFNNLIIGNSAANILDGGLGADAMTGGDGNDVYFVDNIGDTISETNADAVTGGIDKVGAYISYTLGANVEQLVLKGTSAINGTGNSLNNTLIGNSAANILDGGTGADAMIGGDGDDTYVIDVATDIIQADTSGNDTVIVKYTTGTYTLASDLENITLFGSSNINGTGNALSNIIIGNAGNNLLLGGAGNDIIDGGLGVDILNGGDGDDTYVIDVTTDVIQADASGNDTVVVKYTTGTYTLASDLENITLFGSFNINGTGNALNNIINGNAVDNLLNGLAGDDVLIGGLGSDILDGGEGSDVYLIKSSVEHASAEIIDSGSVGIDEVRFDSTISGDTLILFAEEIGIEKVLIGSGTSNIANLSGTVALSVDARNINNSLTIIGNNGDNIISGSIQNDVLIGGAGNDGLSALSGSDVMFGGVGDDSYYINDAGDVVNENVGEGNDTVYLSYLSSYTLGNYVENISYIFGQVYSISLHGNSLNNLINISSDVMDGTITGGDGNDTLNGGKSYYGINLYGDSGDDTLIGGGAPIGGDILDGGTGNDTMIGGMGDDVYFVDSIGDVVIEDNTSLYNIDTIKTTLTSYSLDMVENLTFIGTGSFNGIGNAVDNILIGGGGNDSLSGGDGNDTLDGVSGNDTLIGGTGNDTYLNVAATTIIVEKAFQGIDTITSIATNYTLSSNLENLTYSGNENFTGIGNFLDNKLISGAGNDSLSAGAGNDILNGGLGNDTMIGGTGDDVYYIDSINDVIVENAGEGLDIALVTTSYTMGANVEFMKYTWLTGDVTLTGNASDNIIMRDTSTYNTDFFGTMNGGDGNDTLNGFESRFAMQLNGDAGNDLIYGGSGADIINGGAGNDLLYGGSSINTLTGGLGTDTFYFEYLSDTFVSDVITDFNHTELDKIDLSVIDAIRTKGVNDGVNDTFSYIGTGSFTNTAGQLRFSAGILSGDTNGDSVSDFDIQLTGVSTLTNSDFIL